MSDSLNKALKSLAKLDSCRNEQQAFPKGKEAPDIKALVLTDQILWNLFKIHSKGNYIINTQNEKIVYTILRYFLKDKDFNKEGIIQNDASLDKGLLIFGDNGVGKSFLFQILHQIGRDLIKYSNTNLWFNCITSQKFVTDYMLSTKDNETNFSLKQYYKGKLYIDDLMMEQKAFNKTELFTGVLFERDRNNAITYITTNSKPSEIATRYGRQITDRLPKMFNYIKWDGKSFREE
tara:strand:- start:1004 stop:1708 length:705 start_codon:yes stop_codon:yes gene_type:complete